MTFKGAVFDFDGVVVDTTPLHYYSWERLLVQDYSTTFDTTIYEEVVNGRRSSDVIPELLPTLSIEEIKKALQLKQQYYIELIDQGELKIFASTINLINDFRAKGIKIAVASSSRSVAYILEKSHIRQLFDAVVSGYDTTLGKPHPESFLQAAKKLNLDSSECIVFEDAKVGVQAAKAGGFLCVAVDRKNKPHYYKLADIMVNDLAELNYNKIADLFLI